MLRTLVALVAAIVFGATGASATSVSTWSMSGHDAQNSQFNSTEFTLGVNTVGRLHTVWTAPHVVRAIATNERVYAILPNASGPSRVVVMNAADGKVLLTVTPAMLRLSRFADDTPQALAHPGDTLLVASTRAVVALNPHTGGLRWYAPGGATSMVVNGSTVYTGKGCQNICGSLASYAINLSNGKRLWQHVGNLMRAPAILNGALYVSVGNSSGMTRVYSQRTGTLLGTLRIGAGWLGDTHGAYAFALMGPSRSGAAAPRSWIGSLSAGGVLLWKADLGRITSGNAALAYGTLFAPSNRHNPGVIALNARTGKYVWGANIGPSSNMVVANRLIYVLHDTTGTVDILRTSNGTLVRRLLIGGYTRRGGTGLMVAGGTLYVLGGNGLVALRP